MTHLLFHQEWHAALPSSLTFATPSRVGLPQSGTTFHVVIASTAPAFPRQLPPTPPMCRGLVMPHLHAPSAPLQRLAFPLSLRVTASQGITDHFSLSLGLGMMFLLICHPHLFHQSNHHFYFLLRQSFLAAHLSAPRLVNRVGLHFHQRMKLALTSVGTTAPVIHLPQKVWL